jgi:hypothetical protein
MNTRIACGTALAVLLAGLSGCGGARPADPERARTVLLQSLDAWRNGASPESLRAGSPALTVVEPRWKAGCQLVEYELLGEGAPIGFDWQCRVRLTLREPSGKKIQEQALFTISTVPALVVVRSEES